MRSGNHKKSTLIGSGENIFFNNVLVGINRRSKRGLSGETIENSFDLFTVPAGKSKLEKILKKIFDSLRPRHYGTSKIFKEYFLQAFRI
jgi:hypothetical protein